MVVFGLSWFRDFHWQGNPKILSFVAFFLPLTIGLGFWQLDRAEGKRDILAELQARQNLPALTNETLDASPASHLRQVALRLSLDSGERHILLANSLLGGTVGYEVIAIGRSPQLPSPVLVNRGWVQASLDRSQMPEVETPRGEQLFQGVWYCSQDNPMIEDRPAEISWPAILYELNPTSISSLFGEPVPSACALRLDAASPYAFVANWTIINQSVEKHIGYAVQWFLMATALIILALFANSNLGDLLRGRSAKAE